MIFNFLGILIIVKGILAQNCQLNASHMSKNWIYAIKPTPQNWDVLHTDYLQDQTRLYLICMTNTKIGEFLCNHGNLTQTTPPTPCSNRIRSVISLMPNENSCLKMNGELYQVQYTLPDGTNIPLYQVCYSQINEHAVYARHKSYGFNLPASSYKRPQFVLGKVVSRDCANSYEAANVYNTFVRLLGAKQDYIPNNRTFVIERGHLVNSQDFPTYDQMDETFKYANVIPQFRGSNRSNWKRIENWIHNLPASGTYADVVTGSFGILSLPHPHVANVNVPMYLMPNNANPIPLWSYKVVKYANKCYAFVTLNNDFNINSQISTTNCRNVNCPNGLQFKDGAGSGVSYCCNYYHFVRNVGSHVRLC